MPPHTQDSHSHHKEDPQVVSAYRVSSQNDPSMPQIVQEHLFCLVHDAAVDAVKASS